VVYSLRTYDGGTFELVERPITDIRFTPLGWIGAILGAGAIFFLDFVRVTWLGGLLCLASSAVLG
jgi:hypothetical protein